MKRTLLVLAGILAATGVHAQSAGFERGNTVFTLGTADLDSGQPDRSNLGIQGNYFRASGLGVHYDLAGLTSDNEDAVYGAVGLSQEIGANLRGKFTLGGSNSEEGYFPEFYVDTELEKNLGTQSGLILIGGLSYSKYENDAEEARLRGQVTSYGKPLANGGYFVKQAGLSVSTSLDSDTTGGEAFAAFTYVATSGWSAGLGIAAGRIAYDQQLGAAVENDFWAIRPSVGYRLSDTAELFLRAEHVDTELYDLAGVTVGLNWELN